MKQVKEQTTQQSGSPHTSGGGGGGGTKTWTITGMLRVRESEIEGTSKDRALKGIEVKVQASDVSASGPWTTWGTARTDAQGAFRVTEENNGKTRFFRVQARLVASDLTVEDGSLVDLSKVDIADRNWRLIWKSSGQLSGPSVSLGTKVIASGQPHDLGSVEFRRQAMLWYLHRTTIDELKRQDAWFAIDDQVKVLYPARGGFQVSYLNGAVIHLQEGTSDWKPDVALQWFWQAWHNFHTGSTSEYFRAGFAAFAMMATMHELWGARLKKPYNRRYVAAGLSISTMDELEHEPLGVQHGLRLLRCGGRRSWWSHLFGTAQKYPDNREDADGDGKPDEPVEAGIKQRLTGRVVPVNEPDHLTFWEILRAFRADRKHGWSSDFALSEADGDGLLAFIARVASIHELSEDTHAMLIDALDPLSTKEPFEWLPQLVAAER
ncbi:hypothetical protein [Microbacterium immunditiarum]|uniref:Uncharacterized protein n=1 Tax=Microbacterium immunditiarum TaxID=337480 RepID=A0A7Y9GRX2_9MICO|nr:hypothetical protein [Microbacterium immunditiarum]NYE21496.1 hypothetical protein [Microbacterium immunditiarum]